MRTARRAAGGRALACRSCPSSTSTRRCCATCAPIWRRSATAPEPDMDLLLDLNFNAKTEGYRENSEVDRRFRHVLGRDRQLQRRRRWPISAATARTRSARARPCLGLREFLPYFREQSMDVAIIDAVWNGVWQSIKIAAAADAFEVNIAPHNFYGHLATMMNVHFAAATPNLRIMEVDVDRLPWDQRTVHGGAAIRERPHRRARHSGLGHRAQRRGDPRPSAQDRRRADELSSVLSLTVITATGSGSRQIPGRARIL